MMSQPMMLRPPMKGTARERMKANGRRNQVGRGGSAGSLSAIATGAALVKRVVDGFAKAESNVAAESGGLGAAVCSERGVPMFAGAVSSVGPP